MDAQAMTSKIGGVWRHGAGISPCPVCQPERRKDQRALALSEVGGRLLLHCHKSHCRFANILSAAGVDANYGGAALIAAPHACKLSKARSLWDRSKSIVGTKAETYLRGRNISCDMPESLRFVSDVYHGPSGQFCAVMVANVSTGGVHRTFLDKRTSKRLVCNAKMMLGPCSGVAVALHQGTGQLVVCEGLETGLSLMSGLVSGPVSVWACLSTSGLRALRLPYDVGRLVIATDGDDAGQKAAQILENRAKILGWNVEQFPAPRGQDWNDVLCAEFAA